MKVKKIYGKQVLYTKIIFSILSYEIGKNNWRPYIMLRWIMAYHKLFPVAFLIKE